MNDLECDVNSNIITFNLSYYQFTRRLQIYSEIVYQKIATLVLYIYKKNTKYPMSTYMEYLHSKGKQ